MIGLLAYCLAHYIVAGVAVGYHRMLAHRSFRLRRGFERLVITFGLPAGTPIQWAGNHRFHHVHTDGDLDPHSPVIGGFWYAHNGWYIGTRNGFICLLYALAGAPPGSSSTPG